MAVDVVAALQRVGADVVASFQFPVPFAAVPTQQGGGRRYAAPIKKRPRIKLQGVRDEAEAMEFGELLMVLAVAGLLD